jgi:hypothetical protein
MASDLEQAKALAGIVVVLGVAPALLWMANNMGAASTEQFVAVAINVVWQVAVPAFGLIAFFFVVLKGASVAGSMQ